VTVYAPDLPCGAFSGRFESGSTDLREAVEEANLDQSAIGVGDPM
jgi:hypothetical protein